jgi:hypothetical protein
MQGLQMGTTGAVQGSTMGEILAQTAEETGGSEAVNVSADGTLEVPQAQTGAINVPPAPMGVPVFCKRGWARLKFRWRWRARGKVFACAGWRSQCSTGTGRCNQRSTRVDGRYQFSKVIMVDGGCQL